MSTASQMSLRQRTKSALERIEGLEGEIPRLVAGINGGFQQLESQVNQLFELVNALSQLTGEEDVAAKVTENRIKRAEAIAAAQKENVAKAVEAGRLKVAESIGEKSTIIGQEFTKEGELMPPGRVQMEFSQVRPEFKEKLLGMKAGQSIETPGGGRVEITEVYDFQEPPPQATNADNVAEAAVDAAVASPPQAADAPAPVPA